MKSLEKINRPNYYATTCGKIFKKYKKGTLKEIKGSINGDGYIRVDLRDRISKEGKSWFKHNLVMIAFDEYFGEVDHINRNKEDNRYINLTQTDRSSNVKNREKNNGDITDDELNQVEALYVQEFSLVVITKRTDLSYQQVRRRVKRLKDLGRV